MTRVGLTLGKFLPFHQGHELMLQTAFACVDVLIILVGYTSEDPYSFDVREEWIRQSLPYRGSNTTYIVCQDELDRNAPKNEYGTVTDENYWQDWLKDTKRLLNKTIFNKITHVFTSDAYGERIAKEFEAEWFPVDPDREIIPVSGTKVRSQLSEYFKYLPNHVQRDLTKVVALVGPESTGKSTLEKSLGKTFNCQTVPEWGRTVCKPRNNELSHRAFRAIRDGQAAFIRNAVERSHETPLVITDTEALVTAIYHEMFYPNSPLNHDFYEFAKKQDIDLYIVMSPHVPWVQDGMRCMTEEQRWWFYHKLVNFLSDNKMPFVHTWAYVDYKYREEYCVTQIKRLLER